MKLVTLALTLITTTTAAAFTVKPLNTFQPLSSRVTSSSTLNLSKHESNHESSSVSSSSTTTTTFMNQFQKACTTMALATTLAITSPLSPITTPNANAINIDMGADTVTSMVQSINTAAGNKEETLKAFEELAAVITEGKGLGGDVSYGGVQLERGVVSDEDTTIYNPGLSLLTESEKNTLVKAIVDSKQKALSTNTWSEDNQFGFEFLKTKLDPLHMYELSGYMGILPFYAAVWYLGVLAVQQNFRGFFPVAYIVAALAIFAPVGVLVALGP